MSVASILVLLLVAFVLSKLFRSTKMWWTFMSAILGGLLVGMLSKELVNKADKQLAPKAQVIEVTDNVTTDCMQSLVPLVTVEGTICPTGVAGYIPVVTEDLRDITLITSAWTNGRDSPQIEDDS